jgi:superfamily II DNA helicase RecQ
LVATIALDTGINQADVRFVIHHSLPESLGCYYRETGRLSRDAVTTSSVLFYSDFDYRKLRGLVSDPKSHPDHEAFFGLLDQTKVRDRVANVDAVSKYCTTLHTCRSVQLLQALGKYYDGIQCNKGCDVCRRRL